MERVADAGIFLPAGRCVLHDELDTLRQAVRRLDFRWPADLVADLVADSVADSVAGRALPSELGSAVTLLHVTQDVRACVVAAAR